MNKPKKKNTDGDLGVLKNVPKVYFKDYFRAGVCYRCDPPTSMNPHLGNVKRHFNRQHKEASLAIKQAFDDATQEERQLKLPLTSQAVGKLIEMFLTSPIPLSFLANPALRGLLKFIPSFHPPSPWKFRKMLNTHVNGQIKSAVKLIQEERLKYSICVDTATMRNTKLQFLGVVIHFYNPRKGKMVCMAVDLIRCASATGVSMRNAVIESLGKLGLPDSQLLRVVADGASSMHKGFKDKLLFSNDPTTMLTDDDFEVDEEDLNHNDDVALIDLTREEEESGDDETEEVENSEDVVVPDELTYETREEYADFLENVDSEEVEEEVNLSDFPDEILAYFHCCIHRIQLVLKDVFDKDPVARSLRKKAFSILASFSRSPGAISDLRETDGLSLLFPVATRWFVTLMVYARMIDIEKRLKNVCLDRDFACLQSHDIVLMQGIVDFLTPFKGYIIVLQSSSTPTVSLLHTGLLTLVKNIQKQATKVAGDVAKINAAGERRRPIDVYDAANIGDALIDRIKVRFSDILDLTKADPIFLAASALDTSVSKFIIKHGISLEEVRSALIRCLQRHQIDTYDVQEVPAKKRKPMEARNAFGLPEDDDDEQTIQNTNSIKTIHDEVDEFIRQLRMGNFNEHDPLKFWSQSKDYSSLRRLFFEISSVPASSAAVERLFSHMSSFADKKRNRMVADTVRVRTLGSFNKTTKI